MEPNQKQNVINYIESTLNNIEKYNFNLFVEDSIEMKTIFDSINKNQSYLILCINKLRAILRDNKKVFCPLFANLFEKYLLIFKAENQIPNESLFLIFDILKTNKENPNSLKNYFKEKWYDSILNSLITLYSLLMSSNDNENLKLTFCYVDFLLEIIIDSDKKNINSFILHFVSEKKYLQKISAFLFFKYLNRFSTKEEIIKDIQWESLFNNCTKILRNEKYDNETKKTCSDIYIQIYQYFQDKTNILDNILFKGDINSATDFQKITGYDTTTVKKDIRESYR